MGVLTSRRRPSNPWLIQGSVSEGTGPACAWRVCSRQKSGPGNFSAEPSPFARSPQRRSTGESDFRPKVIS